MALERVLWPRKTWGSTSLGEKGSVMNWASFTSSMEEVNCISREKDSKANNNA